ncbi:MAG: diguanylate cyclase [Leptolyngbya sp. RL_3_1]|nr:diguanylate cyclase [Leptolyngbya sp. RL_3_1]
MTNTYSKNGDGYCAIAPIAVIMGDIDYFKAYNDIYGHQMGDDCLQRVARVLRSAIKRPADWWPAMAVKSSRWFCPYEPPGSRARGGENPPLSSPANDSAPRLGSGWRRYPESGGGGHRADFERIPRRVGSPGG